MKLKTKPQSHDTGIWMEIKFVLEPEEYQFLQKEAGRQSLMVSDLVRQVVLRFIGQKRGSL